MPRWEPDARQRLVVAALHLFTEQGYDNTTVAEITERAGLTKSTFFRYFPDKRDVLAAGQETLSQLFADGVSAAPDGATPMELVAAGLDRITGAMTPLNRELGPMVKAVIATSAELRERNALKQVGMAASAREALRARGVGEAAASVAAELGMLAFGTAFSAWIADGNDQELATLAREALDRLRATITELA